MKTGAIRACIDHARISTADLGTLGMSMRQTTIPTAEAELAALEARLKNREDILRAFAIAAKQEDTVLARDIVAVVDAALKEAP